MDCFKAYDIRGKIDSEITPNFAKQLGNAFSREFNLKNCCIGHDIRLSSPELAAAFSEGLQDAGTNVFDLGVCGSEEIYFATSLFNSDKYPSFDGGVIITASHNPPEYNGFKFVRGGAIPVSKDSGLLNIKEKILNQTYTTAEPNLKGKYTKINLRTSYINYLLSLIDLKSIKKLKILADPGNGCAGEVVKLLAKHLPCEFIFINEKPDGTFPNGVPNPLLPENRALTAKAVKESGADLGLAWDGDFDRCFFYTAKGDFVEGYYIVGLLAQTLLQKAQNKNSSATPEKILYDTRLTWNTIDMVKESGGISIEGRTGHAFMKDQMRRENAIYGGEMSAHHYFRAFSFCDSGMLPWLYLLELMSKTAKSLEELVEERVAAYPCSGEINRKVDNAQAIMTKIQARFEAQALKTSFIDGLSMEFKDWRFNLRCSNTEPLLRLNVESRADYALMQKRTKELLALIDV
ncbi:phosphomannomutase [Desulfovibrio litoralis]|uniref:Phosphomannomutase n=1 Tax=Desulfovibrio litoralis DSM 11393 TaxID=1121455 RepID=A0A1M7T1B8_9BACT|nr:phosphomannomutase [Desulfovibrio litoralis]SHN64508.1 phosphomannomutase [Desulfovibrio litoralis DSM 11393]